MMASAISWPKNTNAENLSNRIKIYLISRCESSEPNHMQLQTLHATRNQSEYHYKLCTAREPIASLLQLLHAFDIVSAVHLRINWTAFDQSNLSNFVQHVINVSNYMASNAITD